MRRVSWAILSLLPTLAAARHPDAAPDAGATPPDVSAAGLDCTRAEPPREGLGLWLRADHGIERQGASVMRWSDRIDGARAAMPGQAPAFVERVLNGHPAVRFDGAGQRLLARVPVAGLESMTIALVLGGVALGLAAIGLFAAMSALVLGRTREIGVRMALGANHRRIVSNVLGRSLRIVLAGAAAGLTLAWWTGQFVREQLAGDELAGWKPGQPASPAVIELLEATAPETPVGKFLVKRGPGIHHLCLEVNDINAKLSELKARGARLIDEQPRIGAGGALARKRPERAISIGGGVFTGAARLRAKRGLSARRRRARRFKTAAGHAFDDRGDFV